MPRTTLEVRLPFSSDCTSCLQDLERRLAATPGIHHSTVDATRGVAYIDVDEAELARHQIDRLMTGAVAGLPAAPALHEAHRAEHEGPPRGVAAAIDPEHEVHGMRQMAQSHQRRLLLVFGVGLLVMTAEAVGGLLANSLVLLADAAHYATDLLSILLALVAVTVGMRPATLRNTFGLQRAEVIAAFVQALALWAVSVFLIWEAYQRLREPPAVDGPLVMLVGGGTLVVNLGLAWILRRGTHGNLNLRAAYLHILSDVLGSAAALLGGALIHFYGFRLADPLLTLFITVLILVFTWRLTKQTLHILLEGAPKHVDPAAVAASLRGLDHVSDVHDLHVWTLTSGVDSLSAHVVLNAVPKDDQVAHTIHDLIRDRFRIHHITVQIEDPQCPCDTVRHKWHPPA